MKNLIILSIIFFTSIISAQTPYSVLNSHKSESEISAALSAASYNNVWTGANAMYNISGDVSNSLILSGRILYVAASGKNWAFPVVGNVGINKRDSLNSGYEFGVAPYWIASKSGQFTLVAHSALNYKILTEATDGFKNEFKFLIGLEAAIQPDESRNAITLSVAPEFIMNTGDVSNQRWGLNITGVLPIANGLGVLTEGVIPFDNTIQKSFAIGVIINSPIRD